MDIMYVNSESVIKLKHYMLSCKLVQFYCLFLSMRHTHPKDFHFSVGKCLSMHQPWASLLVMGIKKYYTNIIITMATTS